MLTNDKYQNGLISLERTKYNINYCKKELFNIVCSGFAARLLDSAYSVDITDELKTLLNNLKTK